MGRTKTIAKIKSRYYWPNQYVDIVKQVSSVLGVKTSIAFMFTVVVPCVMCVCASLVNSNYYSGCK